MGAATFALVNARAPSSSVKHASSGYGRSIRATVVLSSSYATGGETGNWGTSFGMIGSSGGGSSTKQPTAVDFFPQNGYSPQWDAANNKVKVYVSGGTEVTSTTNLSAITFTAIVWF